MLLERIEELASWKRLQDTGDLWVLKDLFIERVNVLQSALNSNLKGGKFREADRLQAKMEEVQSFMGQIKKRLEYLNKEVK